MFGSCQPHQAFHQADVIDQFEMRTSNENSKGLDLYRFEVFVLVPEPANLRFAIENLIFKTWNIPDMIGYKYISLQMDLSNLLIF